MQIIVNGEPMEWKENQTLEQWVAERGYRKERIAIEVNEEIIPKAEYGKYMLSENDKLEVVTFVGGG